MKKIILFTLLANALQAGTYDNRFEFGVKTTAYDYTETALEGQILDTEKSSLSEINGVYGSYDHKLKDYTDDGHDVAYYLNVFASAQYGETDYVGSLLNSGLGYGSYKSTTLNTFYEFQANIKRLSKYDKNTLCATLGIGYKIWERELSSIQLETYRYLFAQASLMIDTKIYNDFTLGLELSGQIAYSPKMDADFSSITNPIHHTFDLGKVYSYKIATPLTFSLYEKINFTTKLEYEYVSIGRSDTVQIGLFNYYEPDSEQNNFSIYAGIEFIF